MADFFGGEANDTARRSRSLYVDLVRPRPGNLLFWLNRVQHPDIHYLSIIHSRDASGLDDYVVPACSQDMNNIPALRGKSTDVILDTPHAPGARDGAAIINLLAGLSDCAGPAAGCRRDCVHHLPCPVTDREMRSENLCVS